MTARRAPAAHVCLRVGSRHEVAFVPFPARAPMFVIGAAGTLVSFTLPEQIEAGHVDFARQLAAKAWAYAVAVERRYRGLPPLPDVPVPYTLTAQAEALLEADPGRAGPGAAARRAGGDGMTADISVGPVRRGRHGHGPVVCPADRQHLHPLLHLRGRRADPDHPGRGGGHHDHQPRPGRGDRGGRAVRPPAGRGGDPVRGRAGEARRQGPHGGRRRRVRRAGGVMDRLMEAGRLELVPPAAPGFSPVCTKEVTSVCARS